MVQYLLWLSCACPTTVCGHLAARCFVSADHRSLGWEEPHVVMLTYTRAWYSWWDLGPWAWDWCWNVAKLPGAGRGLGRRWMYSACRRYVNNLCLKGRLWWLKNISLNYFLLFPLRSQVYGLSPWSWGVLQLFNGGNNTVWLLSLGDKWLCDFPP